MISLNVFQYKNIFPADVNEAAAFLLSLMAFTPPMEERALRRILKTLVCDERVPRVLRGLLSGKYLVKKDTGQGRFYALTARTLSYLDYTGSEKPHHTQRIPDRALLTYRLKGEIIAAKIVEKAVLLNIDAARDDVVQDDPLPPYDTSTLDLYPRSLVPMERVVHAVRDGIEGGTIPFTPFYHKAIYTRPDTPALLHAMENFDAARRHKMILAAKRKKPGPNPTPAQAQTYLTLTHDIKETETALALLTPKCELMTYHHGSKVLSLALLDANGIFVERVETGQITFGILNDAPNGLPADSLARRLDYCATLSDHLGTAASVRLYTLPEAMPPRRLAVALDKAAVLPVELVELPDKNPNPKWVKRAKPY